MIDGKELKIGNRFIREIHTSRGTEYDHDFILSESWMGFLFSNNISLALQDLYPIPLTPTILEQCGFKSYGLSYFRTSERSYFTFGFDHGGIPFYTVGDIIFSNCHYLHQLQNIFFSLTGQELQIKLK